MPRLVQRLAAPEPLQRAAGLGVEGLPVGAQREVNLAVAVDVEGIDANVVSLGAPLDDDVFFPSRVLEPEDALRIDNDDVLLAVAIDIREQHGIADAELFAEFLHAEVGESGCRRGVLAINGRYGAKQERDG